MTPLNVLHVLSQRPEMTGSGIYLEAIMRESRKRGFSTYRVAGVPVESVDRLNNLSPENNSYVVFETDPLNFPLPGMSDVMPYKSSLFKDLQGERLEAYTSEFSHALEAAVSTFQPDIIHTNHLFVLSALARKLFPHLPIVTTCHGTDLRQFKNCPHLRPFVKRHCRNLDRIIALTGDQKADIGRLYDIPEEKIVVVGGGYNETVFTRVPKSPAGTVHILYAGKYNQSKGVPWLLKSLLTLKQHNWHLNMAGSGSGPEFDRCMDLIEQLGPKVTNHGYVNHEKLSELMQHAHIQVLPSFFEGLPLVLFEGLASGCRIITTQLPGFSEIFGKARKDTVDMIPLPPLETIDRPYQTDEARLERALCQSLLNMMDVVNLNPDFDDPQAERIASDYTWPKVFERILSVYNDAIHQKSRPV